MGRTNKKRRDRINPRKGDSSKKDILVKIAEKEDNRLAKKEGEIMRGRFGAGRAKFV